MSYSAPPRVVSDTDLAQSPGPPLVLLSHRAPVSFAELDRSGLTRSSGGLVSALTGFSADQEDLLWVAMAPPGPEADALRTRSAPTAGSSEALAADLRVCWGSAPHEITDSSVCSGDSGSPITLRLLSPPEHLHTPFYAAVANPLLWFIQHHLVDRSLGFSLGANFPQEWACYEQINELAASELALALADRPGARVMIHDYHFYLAPALLRERCPGVLIEHFTHIPWPAPDAWTVLPARVREQILLGLLGADLVGFHTQADARAFLATVSEFTSLRVDHARMRVMVGNRSVSVAAFPISIDVPAMRAWAAQSEVDAKLAELVSELGLDNPGRSLLLRVDRSDPSKNIVRGFLAFELLLEQEPALVGGPVFLALIQPSRQDVPEYVRYLEAIEAEVSRINERFATADWAPIDLRFSTDMELALAAYRRAAVLLVNAVADGMNLVAKEALVVSEHSLTLALSEATGAHEELGRFSLSLHPLDLLDQARVLHEALTLSPERAAALHALAVEAIERNDVVRWRREQLRTLGGLELERELVPAGSRSGTSPAPYPALAAPAAPRAAARTGL